MSTTSAEEVGGSDAAAPAGSTARTITDDLGDQWEYNKPVERRAAALSAEMHDCMGCFWRWVTCGGPGARVAQLYVNGRLSRCMDEYVRFKNCLAAAINSDLEINVLPGPHPLWHIRTRQQASQFWSEQYAHLGARQTAKRPQQDELKN